MILSNYRKRDKMYSTEELKIYYLFTFVDGKVSKEENRKFAQLCKSGEFGNYNKELIIGLCSSIIGEDEEKKERRITEAIKNIAEMFYRENDKQRILWNVINIAYTDKEIAPSEEKIIDFLAKQFEIPKEIYDDMVDVADTMLALVNEQERLKALPEPDKNKIKAVKAKIKNLYKYVQALVEMADVK